MRLFHRLQTTTTTTTTPFNLHSNLQSIIGSFIVRGEKKVTLPLFSRRSLAFSSSTAAASEGILRRGSETFGRRGIFTTVTNTTGPTNSTKTPGKMVESKQETDIVFVTPLFILLSSFLSFLCFSPSLYPEE